MKVKKIMTRDVVTLNQFMSLREAAELLAKHGISGAPVVEPDGHLIGILTEADILRAVSTSADRVKMVYPSLHTMGVFFEMSRGEVEILKAFEEQAKTVVGDVMSKKVVTCRPDDNLNEAARLLYMRNFSRIPVVDEDDRVVGIVSRSDIVRAFSGLANNNNSEEGSPEHPAEEPPTPDASPDGAAPSGRDPKSAASATAHPKGTGGKGPHP